MSKLVKFRLAPQVYADFLERCHSIGEIPDERLERLVKGWLTTKIPDQELADESEEEILEDRDPSQ